jgi:hypothetical protein
MRLESSKQSIFKESFWKAHNFPCHHSMKRPPFVNREGAFRYGGHLRIFSVINIRQKAVSPPSRGLRFELRIFHHKSFFLRS